MGNQDLEAQNEGMASDYEQGAKKQSVRGWMRCCGEGCGHRVRAYCSIIAASPSILVGPCIMLGLMVGLGVWAVCALADRMQGENMTRAQGLAANSGYGLQALVSQFYQPVLTMGSLIQITPSWPKFEPSFFPIAAMLYSAVPDGYVTSITIRPNAGVVRGIYPPNASYIRTDLLNDLQQRQSTLTFIRHNKLSVDIVPNSTDPATPPLLRVRLPVFVPNVSVNETFDLPPQGGCPEDTCYLNGTHAKFWGIVATGIDMAPFANLSNRYLAALVSSNYLLRLTKANANASQPAFIIAQTERAPGPGAVNASMDIPGGAWVLSIEPQSGWHVVWKAPIIAVVVIFSVVFSVLLLLLLISRKEHKMLLTALVPQSVIDKVKGEEDYVAQIREKSIAQFTESGTPAEKMLSLVTCLLGGGSPSTRDLVQIRHALLEGANLYQPINLEEQMAAILDSDVQLALIKTLGGREAREETYDEEPQTFIQIGASAGSSLLMRSGATETSSSSIHDFSTVKGGLQAILATCHTENDSDMASSRLSAAAVTLLTKPDSIRATSNAGSSREQASTSTQTVSVVSASGTPAAEGCGTPRAGVGKTGLSLVCKITHSMEATMKVPRAVLVEEVEALLATAAASWQFDAFALDKVSMGHGLSTLAFFLIQRAGLLHSFQAPPQALARYLCAVEAGYRSNPYHNSIHASGVLHAMHMFICYGGLLPGYVDHLSHLACYLAAVIHDFEHKGFTNDFLINSCDPLASLYNDRSPMENHHLAAAFELLRQPQHNFLAGLSRTSMASVRKLVIDLVLATDMKQHFATVSQFSTVHMLPPNANADPSVHNGAARRSNGGKSVEIGSGGDSSGLVMAMTPIDDAERLLSLQMALKCSDLSHLFNDLDVHIRWVGCLEQEFFQQGDREKDAGLPVSPLFDRDKPGVSKSQVGFYSFVAEPLFRHFTKVFKGAKPAYKQLLDNLAYWRKVEGEAKQKEATALKTAMDSSGGASAGKSLQVGPTNQGSTAFKRSSADPLDPSERGKPKAGVSAMSRISVNPLLHLRSPPSPPHDSTMAAVRKVRGSN